MGLDTFGLGDVVISGQHAVRLSTAVRAALDELVRFEERGLEDVEFFNLLASKVAEAVDADKVGVGLLEGDRLRMRGSFGFPLEVAEAAVVPVAQDGAGIADRIVFQDVVFIGDLHDDPELEPYAEVIGLLGVREAIAVAWRVGDQRLGAIAAFDSNGASGFDADDVLVLRLAADVSAFVYRQRQVRKREEVLLQLTDELSRLPTFEAMATATARVANQLLPNVECGIVEVPRARPTSLRTLAMPRGNDGLLPEETDAAGSGAATVIATGRPLETDDLERFSKHGAALVRAGFRRVRCLPVTAGRPLPDGRRALGAIGFLSRSQQPFSDEDRALMDDLAHRLGLLAHRAELLEQHAETTAGLQLALDAAIEIGSSLDPPLVIERLLRRATEALAADRATLSSIDGDDLVIEGSYAAAGPAFEVGRRFQYKDSRQFMTVLRTRQPMHETYQLDEVEETARDAMAGVMHSVTVPIVEADEVIATVTVSRRSDRPFAPADGRLLELVTAGAGVAMRNARLLEDARQASRAKSDFLNMAGHELRTPLAVIRGYLSLVASGAYGDPPNEWRPVLELLDEKSRDLASMVESILVAARLQSGRLQLGADEVDIVAVVRRAVERAGAAAALTGGAVVGRYPRDLFAVRGDRTQLGVIVDNLLANAIKYSAPPAAVTVTVDHQGEQVEVRVADRGRGIARENWNRIFEEFVRVEEAGGDYAAGTGLGLYIARQLAERYSGSLEIESSELGTGSTFVLRLPVS